MRSEPRQRRKATNPWVSWPLSAPMVLGCSPLRASTICWAACRRRCPPHPAMRTPTGGGFHEDVSQEAEQGRMGCCDAPCGQQGRGCCGRSAPREVWPGTLLLPPSCSRASRSKALARLRRGGRGWQHSILPLVVQLSQQESLGAQAVDGLRQQHPSPTARVIHGRTAAAYNSSNVLSSLLITSSYPPQMLGRQPLLYRHVAEQRNCLLLMAPHLLSGNSPRLSHFPNRLLGVGWAGGTGTPAQWGRKAGTVRLLPRG